MSKTLANDLHHGRYTDVTRPWGRQTQYLTSASKARIWTNFLGILVAIGLARAFLLILQFRRRGRPNLERADAPEGFAVLALMDLLKIWKEGRIQLPPDDPMVANRANILRNRAFVRSKLFEFGLMGLTYAGFLISGVLTAYLATDSIALSNNPDCGVYSNDNFSEVSAAMSPFAFQAQVDSAQLAENCFNKPHRVDGCNYFVQQSIPYKRKNTTCPFAESVCHNTSSAIYFSTGAVDAATIGVHTSRTFQFQRETTCAPLNNNDSFISVTLEDGVYTIQYRYGSWLGGPYTMQTKTWESNLDWQAHYLVDTATSFVSRRGLIPIPELAHPQGSSLTLLFIHPRKISYAAPSDDPIFPASTKIHFNFTDEPRWRYADVRANVMACLDTTKWRDLSVSSAWNSYPPNSIPIDSYGQDSGAFFFMGHALMWSSTFHAIDYRLGSALLAQKLVKGWTSLPLFVTPMQWMIEAEHLFATSIARIMIDARNIAQGAGAAYPGLKKLVKVNSTDGELASAAMCDRTFLFRSEGWLNVNVTGSVWILALCTLFILLAIPFPNDKLLVQAIPGFFTESLPRFYEKVSAFLRFYSNF